MPVKPGMYLGGIRSVDDLKERCRVDEDTGCWHWLLWCWDSGLPGVWLVQGDKRGKVSGRRAALILAGKCVRRGDKAFATPNCFSIDCVNPAHCRLGSMRDVMQLASERGKFDDPRCCAHLVLHAKAHARLSEEQRLDAALSTETARQAAERLGVSERTIAHIRGARPRLPASSVFSWRPA